MARLASRRIEVKRITSAGDCLRAGASPSYLLMVKNIDKIFIVDIFREPAEGMRYVGLRRPSCATIRATGRTVTRRHASWARRPWARAEASRGGNSSKP